MSSVWASEGPEWVIPSELVLDDCERVLGQPMDVSVAYLQMGLSAPRPHIVDSRARYNLMETLGLVRRVALSRSGRFLVERDLDNELVVMVLTMGRYQEVGRIQLDDSRSGFWGFSRDEETLVTIGEEGERERLNFFDIRELRQKGSFLLPSLEPVLGGIAYQYDLSYDGRYLYVLTSATDVTAAEEGRHVEIVRRGADSYVDNDLDRFLVIEIATGETVSVSELPPRSYLAFQAMGPQDDQIYFRPRDIDSADQGIYELQSPHNGLEEMRTVSANFGAPEVTPDGLEALYSEFEALLIGRGIVGPQLTYLMGVLKFLKAKRFLRTIHASAERSAGFEPPDERFPDFSNGNSEEVVQLLERIMAYETRLETATGVIRAGIPHWFRTQDQGFLVGATRMTVRTPDDGETTRHQILVWDHERQSLVSTAVIDFTPNHFAVDRERGLLVISDDRARIFVLDLNSGVVLGRLEGHVEADNFGLESLAIDPASGVLTTFGKDQMLLRWDLNTVSR